MTTLNGWQRIWLLASVFWAVVILLLAGILQPDRDQTVQSALFDVRLWIVRVVAVYGFGPGLAWGPPLISSRVKVSPAMR